MSNAIVGFICIATALFYVVPLFHWALSWWIAEFTPGRERGEKGT